MTLLVLQWELKNKFLAYELCGKYLKNPFVILQMTFEVQMTDK